MLPFLYTQIGCPCASPQGGTHPLAVPPIPCHTNSMKNTHLEHPEDTILTGDLSALDWFEAAGAVREDRRRSRYSLGTQSCHG